MTQDVLFTSTTGQRVLRTLPVAQLTHSLFNPRRVRPDTDIEKLANRMLANGYEVTRAVWAHAVNDHYEVFAGGTRLEAAHRAGLDAIPTLVHSGYTDGEIVRLAEQDNENDEYHAPVPIVDTWLSYKALADAGWTQAQIASAKGCSQTLVSFRLACAKFPPDVHTIITKNGLNERHAREIVEILPGNNLTPWLARETVMLEVIDATLRRTKEPTAKDFAAVVKEYNAFLDAALQFAAGLDPTFRAQFIALLKQSQARNLAKVQTAIDTITKQIAAEKRQSEEAARRAQSSAEAARVDAERAEHLVTAWETWRAANVNILHGDFRTVGAAIPDDSVDLIFTDPPYDESTIPLYGDLAQFAARVLKPNGSLIAYVGHYALPQVLNLMTPHLRYWWLLAVDHAGGSARLPGKWIFVNWKPLVWFVKGGRADNAYVADQVNSRQTTKSLHPWQQDTSEATYYIEHLTQPGAMILDPFAGSGTTLIAGLQLGRHVIGIELAEQYIDTMQERTRAYYEHREAA